jgi:hypothetical protein
MNQNLFRVFAYVSTSSFFNTVSVTGYVIRETGSFTDSNLHSHSFSGAIDFRVGRPWGKTALITGWGTSDQKFEPVNFEDYYTSAYLGLERKVGERLNLKAVIEDLRAWRVVGANSGIAQNLRPAGTIDFAPSRKWDLQVSSAYSSTRSFHAYDAIQNGFLSHMLGHSVANSTTILERLCCSILFDSQPVFNKRPSSTLGEAKVNSLDPMYASVCFEVISDEDLFSCHLPAQWATVERVCVSHCAGAAKQS